MQGFHAHIYYRDDSRAKAEALWRLIGEELGFRLSYKGTLLDRMVGPHPIPMFMVSFAPENFTEIVLFLVKNHNDLSVLIHPETGNDLADHTIHALWLGEQLKLDLSRF